VFSDQPAPGAERQLLDDARVPPPALHVCWTNCFTLVAQDGAYVRTDGTDESWSVERFTGDEFVLRRHGAPAEWNGFHADVTYAGQIANDRLVNVTVNGQPVSDIQMAWGSALDSLPGSNAERDRLAAEGSPPTGEPLVTASQAPPPPREEEQPANDVAGSIWTPGYWNWGTTSYYWVPGAWVRAPRVGVLWTPGYWVLTGGVYVFHRGYWGPHVGYYGGINYGYGYFGAGYSGGRWVGAAFVYNTAVSHVNTSVIRDTYHEPAHVEVTSSKLSHGGAPSGTTETHTTQHRVASVEPHTAPPQRTAQSVAPRRTAVAASQTHTRSASTRVSHASPRPSSGAQRESTARASTSHVQK
jgi:WXXGXW repeat (2 copies)